MLVHGPGCASLQLPLKFPESIHGVLLQLVDSGQQIISVPHKGLGHQLQQPFLKPGGVVLVILDIPEIYSSREADAVFRSTPTRFTQLSTTP